MRPCPHVHSHAVHPRRGGIPCDCISCTIKMVPSEFIATVDCYRLWKLHNACRSSPHKPFAEVEMAKKQTRSSADPLTHPFLEKLGAIPAAAENLFAYSVKIVCGKQTDTNCCCVAGTRPGVYATEVNIQNLNLVTAPVVKFVVPLINSGAVVAREPNVDDPATLPRRAIRGSQTSPVGGDDGRLLPHRGVAAWRAPERKHRAHHRHPDDREPGRAVRLRGLHGEPSERGRHQHRRRVHSVATIGTSWPGLVGSKNAKMTWGFALT